MNINEYANRLLMIKKDKLTSILFILTLKLFFQKITLINILYPDAFYVKKFYTLFTDIMYFFNHKLEYNAQ